ncbi:MAG: ParB/RepB/Spo0J family partition protein, partial [Comamonas sp.]|nr:ParB/RepB/Spo0J family partition protein [Comamonas sp.]
MSKAAQKPVDGAKASGMDLGSIGDLSALMDAPEAPVASSGPLILDMSLIDEDPNQPRKDENPGFSPESIAEIGATIKARGVKTPISVRENPDDPGRYLINHGARRFRGSKWAEKTTIPGFIDNDYNEADQVIENLQRNDLTPREIADFVGRELAKGKKKGDIAKEIGKSASFVSQHVTLLDLPDPIAEAFNSGRVKDVTLINELVTAHKKAPEEVTEWLEDDTQEVTRGSVKLLREFLDDKNQQGQQESLAEQALRDARERTGGDEESPEGDGEAEADFPQVARQ